MRNKLIAAILATVTICGVVIQNLTLVSASANTISIDSKEDFISFAEKCTLDTWSAGKRVILNCDIEFSKKDFLYVPTFGGNFEGNGYTISGISYDEKGSYIGLFRYLQRDGKVSDLNVEGKIKPNGSKSYVGGIVGENSGAVINCSFNGTVQGENVIGGIAGSNTEYGSIIKCRVSGNIGGENSTGGIAGKNSGCIRNCTNDAAVNTVYEEKKSNISDLESDIGSVIESYKTKEEENNRESILEHSDTGGIAGYSSGIVQGCINNGAVGYSHIGYNVGGIAGRQSGYMPGCKNYGFIQGRKDVGGIVGQAEPYILLNTSEDILRDLETELENLHNIVNEFIIDGEALGDNAKRHLDKISENAQNAQNNTEELLNMGTDFVDDNLEEINVQAAILSDTMDKLTPVFDNMEEGCDDLSEALEELSEAIGDINIYAPDLEEEIKDISSALKVISKSEKAVNKAITKAENAKDAFDEAIGYNNIRDMKNAVSKLNSAIKEIIGAKKSIKENVDEIIEILQGKTDDFENIGVGATEIAENLKSINENIKTMINAFGTIKEALEALILTEEIDYSEIKSAVKNTEASIRYIQDAMFYISSGLVSLGNTMEDMTDKLSDYAEDMTDEIDKLCEKTSESLSSLSHATDSIRAAIKDMNDILSDLGKEEALEFVTLGEDFRNTSENIFNSLSGISDGIDGLKNSISEDNDKITSDLTSVSNQFNVVMNLLTGEVEELKNGAYSLEDIFVDTSEEDIENTRQGKIADCVNFGRIEADRNTGGIVGAMAIEYTKDPEDELEKPETLNFTYRTKAILQSCVNDGKAVGKKDCTGGIVGLSELGTVYKCESYAEIESENGNYVGGIAGKSNSAIRKSYAKARLSGKRYVGGIAGKGDIITNCYSIVNAVGEENVGSILGDAEKKEKIYRNFYVDNGLGAVDGISYKNRAEAVSYDELKNIAGIPSRFIAFTVTFFADDKIVETKEVKYGEKTTAISYPEIPKKKGSFGKWEKIEAETVTEDIEVNCEYKPYITIIASNEKNENGKLALVLAEGEFTDEARLYVRKSDYTAPVRMDENVIVYDISLKNTSISDNDEVTIRVLNENKDKVTAWVMRNGAWEKSKATAKGKYICINTQGSSSTVCLKYEEKGSLLLWVLSLFVTAAIGAGAVLLFKKRKKDVNDVEIK